MDREKMIDGLRQFLSAFGDQLAGEDLELIAGKVADAWSTELLAGYHERPEEILASSWTESDTDMVLMRDIDLVSICNHHLLPFVGKAQIAYVANQKIVGLSKLARLAQCFARRLQTQERLTNQIATALMEELEPRGAACVIEAEHLCVLARGVKQRDSRVVTMAFRGVFQDDPAYRERFFALIGSTQRKVSHLRNEK